MSTIGTVLTVVLIVIAVVLATIVLMQSKRSAGLGAVSGGSGADSFFSLCINTVINAICIDESTSY